MGAFRKKAGQLLHFAPDLAVIQECERPEKLLFPGDLRPRWQAWFGDADAAKGVGLFSFSDGRFELADEIYDASIRYCIPLRGVEGFPFNLIAIWAMPNKGNARQHYVGQIWQALDRYASFISERDTLLIGDFNSNPVFDRKYPIGNHSMLVERLKQAGITSVYHRYFLEQPGSESQPTFYLYKRAEHPYHLDYCFAPQSWPLRAVSVGGLDVWRQWSDHCPLFVEFG